MKPDVYLKAKNAPIRTQLQEWIAEEMQYLEKRCQLAYRARLALEAGLVTQTQLSSLLRFLSGHVQTRHAGHISFDSLRTKYYNPEQSTKASVKDLLIKMLNLIRKQ